jgi:hypothetical protein
MNKSQKILLGIATLFPIIYTIIFFTIIIFSIYDFAMFSDFIYSMFDHLFTANIFIMILTIALIIIYIIHILKNTMTSEIWKIIWIILICAFNIIAMPIYYYIYIVKKQNFTTKTVK